MKKVMISLVTVMFAVVSMSFMLNNDDSDAPLSKNSCTIKVTNSSGNGISSVRVVSFSVIKAQYKTKHPKNGKIIILYDNGTWEYQKYFGKLKDSRDGKTYKTIKIGTQTWMAENINYKTSNSWCYNNSSSNCEKYGRLYTWNAAKFACPTGWHLPSDAEWTKLANYLGGEKLAGKKLKSATGWELYEGKNYGNNESGFGALPGGDRDYFGGGSFGPIGEYGDWWSSTPTGSEYAWDRSLYCTTGEVDRHYHTRPTSSSVRCLKD